MKKFLAFLKKKEAEKQSFCCPFPFDPFPIEVYRSYEFDSENSLVTYQNSFTFGPEKKLKNHLKVLEDANSQLVYSGLKHSTLNLNTSDTQYVSPEKPEKCIYAITMRNCKYFHIGPQRIVNISKNEHLMKSWSLQEKFNILLDSYRGISDISIMVISLHIGNNWKKFGTGLGFHKNYLEELNYRNDANVIVLSFDILQKYLTLFPNTSLGFIVKVLHEIQQEKIIEEIAKNIII